MRTDRPTPLAEHERRLLPDVALAHAPKPVTAAHADAAEAVNRHRALVTAARETDIAAANADGADQQAIKAALDAGKAPPKPTAKAKRQAAQDARRNLDASAALLEEKFAALTDTIASHHREWADALAPQLEDATAKAQAAVAATADAFAGFDNTTGVLAYLRAFDPNRPKTQELRQGVHLIAPGEDVARHPSALLAALSDVAAEYQTTLSTGDTEIERQQAETARNVARRAIRHQQRQERRAKAKTTKGFVIN